MELEATVIPDKIVYKPLVFKVVVGTTCALSILGSLLIIISYVLFKDLRTQARLILAHLSVADLGVGASNLFGIAYGFDSHFNNSNTAGDSWLLSPPSVDKLCKAQAFTAHFFTISSVLWTMALAVYMYTVITRLKLVALAVKVSRSFLWSSCVFCYGMSLLVTVWMLCTTPPKLGFSPYDAGGWCSTIIYKKDHHKVKINYMSSILGYDLWIITTCIFIIAIYTSLHFYVRQEVIFRSTILCFIPVPTSLCGIAI